MSVCVCVWRLGAGGRETGFIKALTSHRFFLVSLPPPVEALNGTLRAAKKRGVIYFDGELLLQGVHDGVDVVLLADAPPDTVE